MVAEYAVGGPGLDHRHDDAERVGCLGAAIDEIAEEDHAAAGWCGDAHGFARARAIPGDAIAELAEQDLELVGAAVHVADDVERPFDVARVGPQPGTLHGGSIDLLRRAQLVDVAESLLVEAIDVAFERAQLVADDVRAELAVGAQLVALMRDLLARVDDDGDGHRMVALGQPDQLRAVLLAHVGRVDDDQPAALQARLGDIMDELEGVVGRVVAVLVVVNEAARGVRRHDLGRLEMPRREGRLAGARRADQRHEAEIGDRELHRVNTPICEGAPWVASSAPRPVISTA